MSALAALVGFAAGAIGAFHVVGSVLAAPFDVADDPTGRAGDAARSAYRVLSAVPERARESLDEPMEMLLDTVRDGAVAGTAVPEESGLTSDSIAAVVGNLRARELLVPVRGVPRDDLADHFHAPRGEGRSHRAIDIMAPRGTPVVAVEDGRVAKLYLSNGGGGIALYLFDAGETFGYYYAHLDRWAAGLEEGDLVRRGQVIGYVGTTGNAPPDAPHLHFAITLLTPEKRWWEGTPVNPYLALR